MYDVTQSPPPHPFAPSPHDASDLDDAEATPHYSPVRVAVALVVVLAALGAGGWWLRQRLSAPADAAVATSTWYAPYVDATLTPTYQFQDPSLNPARQSVLGFVVASGGRCAPSWGDSYDLGQADASLNLTSRIAQYHAIGGDTIISFGGRDHVDLAESCASVASLTRAYQQVVSRYHPELIDFDVEGSALTDVASINRRAAAVASLIAHNGGPRHLGVWITVPAGPGGLPEAALEVARAFFVHQVVPAGIDAMSMDFGQRVSSMSQSVLSVATAAQAQVADLYQHYGVTTSLSTRFGLTVMIGENDSVGENLTIAGATRLAREAAVRHWGRVSMWSLNRDAQCGSAFAEVGVLSNSCSGAVQSPLGFSKAFGVLTGRDGVGAPASTSGIALAPSNAPGPYPQWLPSVPYPVGYKVVRDGEIYQAKWYTQGQDPATVVQFQSQTPWQLIGPVLAGSRPPTTTTLPAGTYGAWSPATAYSAGQRVLFNGLPYQAKWYNVAQSPASQATDPTGSPWQALFTVPGEPPLG
jgi:chitinase